MNSVVERNKDFSANSHSTTKHLKHSSISNLLRTLEVRTLLNSNSNFVTYPSPYDLYCVGGTLSLIQSINSHIPTKFHFVNLDFLQDVNIGYCITLLDILARFDCECADKSLLILLSCKINPEIYEVHAQFPIKHNISRIRPSVDLFYPIFYCVYTRRNCHYSISPETICSGLYDVEFLHLE